MDEGTPLDLEVKKAVMDMLQRFRGRSSRAPWDLVRALVLSAVTVAVALPGVEEDEIHALVENAWPLASESVRKILQRGH